jgi:hypothetical protein
MPSSFPSPSSSLRGSYLLSTSLYPGPSGRVHKPIFSLLCQRLTFDLYSLAGTEGRSNTVGRNAATPQKRQILHGSPSRHHCLAPSDRPHVHLGVHEVVSEEPPPPGDRACPCGSPGRYTSGSGRTSLSRRPLRDTTETWACPCGYWDRYTKRFRKDLSVT